MQIRSFVFVLLLPVGLQAQFFYNATRDAKGQQALTQAKAVANGQVFDKMVENLDRLSRASGDRFFNDAERQMRANLSFFRTWGNVRTFTRGLEGRLQADAPEDATPAQISAAVTEVETETNKAQESLKTLQDAAKTKFTAPAQIALIGTWLAQLGDLSDLIGFAQNFKAVQNAPAGFVDAANEAAALATSLGNLYQNFSVAISKTPDMVVLETQIQLLAVNEDHLKQLARIITQRETDLQDTRVLLRRVKAQLDFLRGANVQDTQDIAQTISAQVATPGPDARVLGAMVFVMYNAAALAARDTTPKRLASLRLADEERRYSIRASAVAAQSYETLVSTGVERLATYYKGGIRPETLAQLATALGTLGLIPTIAVK
jgi:hypothetical protein